MGFDTLEQVYDEIKVRFPYRASRLASIDACVYENCDPRVDFGERSAGICLSILVSCYNALWWKTHLFREVRFFIQRGAIVLLNY